MGFLYFSAFVGIALIGYYIYIIKQEVSPQQHIGEDLPESEIEYVFEEPIKVSEEYIIGARDTAPIEGEAQKSESHESEIGATEAEAVPQQPQEEHQESKKLEGAVNTKPQLKSSDDDFLLHHLIDFSLAKNLGKTLSSIIDSVISPSVATTAKSEVEFFHLGSADLSNHIRRGRQMFADVPIL